MGVEGLRVDSGVSRCWDPIGLQLWLPTTGMPGPRPRPPEVWGAVDDPDANIGSCRPLEPTGEQGWEL